MVTLIIEHEKFGNFGVSPSDRAVFHAENVLKGPHSEGKATVTLIIEHEKFGNYGVSPSDKAVFHAEHVLKRPHS